MRCEGRRRYGGAFLLGPPRWVQCEEDATVKLRLVQNDEPEAEMYACATCWKEAKEHPEIEILEVLPLDERDEVDLLTHAAKRALAVMKEALSAPDEIDPTLATEGREAILELEAALKMHGVAV